MKLLVIASDKGGHFVPFIEEQITALQAKGVQVIRYGITGKGILGYLRALPELKRMIRAEKPDIIHAHYGLSGLLANLQRRVPVVTTYHGSDINNPSVLRFSKIAMRLSAHNIFVSKRNVILAYPKSFPEGKDFNFNGYTPSPSRGESGRGFNSLPLTGEELCSIECPEWTFIEQWAGVGSYTLQPCGVNIPEPWSEMQHQLVEQLTLNQWVQEILNNDVKNILFAGAFDNAVKDPELAKAAMNELTSNGVKASLIELKGYSRDQVNALMYNCNALLMTSKTEGSPQVIKEAMACGCPIVSVDVGDVAERTNGVEGCYVVPSREPADIAEALRKAIAYDGKTNGRERILEMGLSNEQVAKRLIEIYKQVCV